MRILFEKHLSKRLPPANLKNEDLALFEHEFFKEIRATSYIHVRNATILQDIMVDRALRYKKYLPYCKPYLPTTALQYFKRMLMFLKKKDILTSGVWITDTWSENYFHWMTDALPRLIASSKVNENLPVILPSSYEKYGYVLDSLKMLNRRPFFYGNKPLLVKQLLLPSHTASTGNYNRTYLTELRNRILRFVKADESGNARKIYISRQKAQKRKIQNEVEVLGLMDDLGFETHCFEELSFYQQVKLVSQARIIIGQHGAGLTNILYMKEKGKILEFRNSDDCQNNCYFSLASELGHEYFYQICPGDRKDAHSVNIVVDIAELKRNLIAMGCT